MRPLLGVVVLFLAGWLAWSLMAPPAPAAPAQAFTSSSQCAECHQDVYDEWVGSQHANSWLNEALRAQTEVLPNGDLANKNCVDCHAPRGLFERDIGERVFPRSSRRAEGVDCLTCHLIPEEKGGGVAGTITNKSAACRPTVRTELQQVNYCASCHNQHFTVDQYEASSWPDKGEDCLSCHMPYRDGDPSKGRDHRMLGGHHLPLVQQAVELNAERRNGGIVVTIANVWAGHAFPTDERSRAADIFWRPAPEDPQTRGGWTFLHRMRDPYRYETDIARSLLEADEVRDIELTGEGLEGPIEVALFYKLAPYYRDPETGEPMATEVVTDPLIDSRLVHRVVVQP